MPALLQPHHVTRLEAFFERIRSETYPEPSSELHSHVSRRMLEYLDRRYTLAPWTRVLDVGCGQGVALELFAEHNCRATGITLNAEDVRVCRERGHDVYEMDQSFLDFPDEEFDLIWCRHCLEHSVMPLFTLAGFARVLRPGGLLYMEVPAPDTACRHQTNANHYSVLPHSMWEQLISRAGFGLVEANSVDFMSDAGPDTYWAFIARKRPAAAS
jgi:SAM-dependent methyltransferase